jgi:hypothetical protein
MSKKAFDKIAEGLREVLSIARGEPEEPNDRFPRAPIVMAGAWEELWIHLERLRRQRNREVILYPSEVITMMRDIEKRHALQSLQSAGYGPHQ